MTKKIAALQGIIFDLDGTLVHSGLDFKFIRNQLGCPQDQDILTFIENLEPDQQLIANQVVAKYELQDAQNPQWIAGVETLLMALSETRIPIAIVTRNSRQAARLKLANSRVQVERVITREDAPAKPDPTALLMIADEWQLAPNKIAYVGDYLYDVQAANNAGMVSCLYAPSYIPDYAHLADWCFNHFDEFHAALFQS